MADPPKLPKNAPQELKDFVACVRDEVTIDPANADWIPKPKKVPKDLAPTATVTPGPTANSANVTVGYAGGFIGITLPVSVAGGHLQVDTSNLSSFDDLVEPINDWVKQLNDQLDESGKALDGLTVKDGKVVLKKRRAGATQPGTGTTTTPAVTPKPPSTSPPKTTDPKPGGDKKEDAANGSGGCLLGILVGLLLVGVLGAGAFIVLRGDDGDNVTADLPSTVATLATTTTSPAAPEPTLATTVPSTVASSTSQVIETTTTAPRTACGVLAEQANGLRAPRGTTNASWWDDPRLHDPCDEPIDGLFPPLPMDLRSMAFPPFTSAGQQVGVDHTRSVVDAETNALGLSLSEFNVYTAIVGDVDTGAIKIASNCGGDVSTGSARLVPNGVTLVEQPLLHFGTCNVTQAYTQVGSHRFWISPQLFGAAGIYFVNADQPPPGDPVLWDGIAGWMRTVGADQPLLDVFGVLGGGALEPDCLSFAAIADGFIYADPVQPCAVGARSRLLLMAMPPRGMWSPIYTAAAFGNAGGAFAPAEDQFAGTNSWAPLFANTIFPCGFGQVGFTVCPDAPATGPVSEFVAVGLQFADNLLTSEAVGEFVITATQTGRSWTLAKVDGAWSLTTEGDTAARAIVRNGSLVFAIPQAEVGVAGVTYEVRPGDGEAITGGVIMSGALHTPAGSAAPSAPAAGDVEDLDAFLEQLSASISAGDGGFAVERLDPHVIEQFGEDACRAEYNQAKSGFEVVAVEVLGTEPWDWPLPDGTTVPIAEAVFVSAQITEDGQTRDAELHLTVIDGQYRWFTYCA